MNLTSGQIFVFIAFSAAIFFTLGILAGYLVSLLRSPRQPSKPKPIEKVPATRDTQSTPVQPGEIELARIYRRIEDDQVFLKAEGRLLKTPADVNTTERTWLVLAAEAIYHLLSQKTPQAQKTPPAAPAASPPPAIDWSPAIPVEFEKPSMNPADVIIRAAQAGQPRAEPPKSLVEQIDGVLQEILQQSPLPVGEIHLAENADLGLEVRVGSQRYDGIEAVPDAQVRQAIRNAIAEWQKRAQQPKS
ncbi:MAG: hypothetical protein MUC85_01675 [Anaerolineales bacterium]|nr:hypothetical protein [Anaerolineales bacterium]